MLTPEEISFSLAPQDFERGRRYQRQGRARLISISNDGTAIEGDVRGTRPRPYDVRVRLDDDGHGLGVDGWCTCPVGFNCKHVAALLLEAAVSPKMPAIKLQTALSPSLNEWLSGLDRAFKTETEDYPDDVRHRLIYVMSLSTPLAGGPRLLVETLSVRLLKDGSFSGHIGCYNPSNVFNGQPAKYLRPSDREVLKDIARSGSHEYSTKSGRTAHVLTGETAADIIGRMLETGRARWASLDGPVLARGDPRPAEPGWILLDDGGQRFTFDRAGGGVALPLAPPWYVEPDTGLCGPLVTALPDGIAAALLDGPSIRPIEVPTVRDELARRFPELPALLPEPLGDAERIEAEPVPCLRLMECTLKYNWVGYGYGGRHGYEARDETLSMARLSFDYGGQRIAATAENRDPTFVRDGRLITVVRDTAAERRAFERLNELGLGKAWDLRIYELSPDQIRDLIIADDFAGEAWLRFLYGDVPALEAEGWRIETDEDFPLRLAEADDEWTAEIEEGSGIDWFELHLGVTVDGARVDILPLLIELIRGNWAAGIADDPDDDIALDGTDDERIFIPLADGRVLPLPLDRLKPIVRALHDLFDAGAVNADGRLGFDRSHAADLALLEEATADATGLEWRGGETLRDLGRRLRNFRGIEPAAVPDGFIGELRPYQQDGLNWLQFLRQYDLGGVLADDMGLGKTVQALAHLVVEKDSGRMDRPSLVVAPTSLMANWRIEAERFAPGLKVLTLHGPDRKARFGAIGAHDIVLTTYPLLARDRDALLGVDWHVVILDEAQMIKNPRTTAAQVARSCSARHRLCLTGTPMENHLGELWSLFSFLMPGLLGEWKSFGRAFRTPIEKRGDGDRRALLNRRIRPFLLRRTKGQVAADLPPKSEIIEHVEMESAQRDLYESVRLAMHEKVRREIAAKGLARSHIIVLDALLKMRQACCDPRLVKIGDRRSKARSAKLLRLMEMVPALLEEGRRILLFSQFTSMLDLIMQELDTSGIPFALLTGKTKNRAEAVERFQGGEVPLFLISLKAGGTGLNLTAADAVIHYDPWWNPAVETQATDRAHRIGQDKAVFVHKMITLASIEEKMLDLQDRKRALAEGLFATDGGTAAGISEEDIAFLFDSA